MLKDTKSLGNNKAPACESRGFVHKKRGVHFDTPPCRILFVYKGKVAQLFLQQLLGPSLVSFNRIFSSVHR